MTGEVFENLEVERQNKDGNRIDLSISTALLRDEIGEIDGCIAVCKDITDLKRREQDLH